MPILSRSLIAIGALVLSVAAHAHEKTPPASFSQTVTVSGAVERSLTLNVEQLRQYPAQKIIELQLPGRGTVRGVRLRDIVEQAKVVQRDHNTVKKLVLVASATDGYKVVFSWSEISNSEAGDSVLVLFERDGKPLPVSEGPLALISAKDIRTGPRHVKWLQAIDVREID